MSIYPVRLSKWFPVGDEMYQNALSMVKYTKCFACFDKVSFKKAIGHHSVPWGYGEIWCSEKCLNSGKVGKPDKRQRRKIKRIFKCLN